MLVIRGLGLFSDFQAITGMSILQCGGPTAKGLISPRTQTANIGSNSAAIHWFWNSSVQIGRGTCRFSSTLGVLHLAFKHVIAVTRKS